MIPTVIKIKYREANADEWFDATILAVLPGYNRDFTFMVLDDRGLIRQVYPDYVKISDPDVLADLKLNGLK